MRKAVSYYRKNVSHERCDGFEDLGQSTGPGEMGLTAYGLARKGGDPVSTDQCGLVEVASP
jgi:hypothetical protein